MAPQEKKSAKVRLKGGGIEEAAKMLAALSPQDQERIMQEMIKQDPTLSERIQQNLLGLEDLKSLTPVMLRKLMKEIPIADFGLALRATDSSVLKFICQSLSENNRRDLMDIYQGPPQSMSKVDLARQQVLKVLREKVQSGEFVIKKKNHDPLV